MKGIKNIKKNIKVIKIFFKKNKKKSLLFFKILPRNKIKYNTDKITKL